MVIHPVFRHKPNAPKSGEAFHRIFLAPVLLTTLILFGCGESGSTDHSATDDTDHAVWDIVTLTFAGPRVSENAPSTFLDYRLTVTFTNGNQVFVVPGYFAADGNAANTHATSGNQWHVKFTPNTTGRWTYRAVLETGPLVAIKDEAGTPVELESAAGSFTVGPSQISPDARDFRGKGRLAYVDNRYLRFEGTGKSFLKGGAGSPENLLGYYGFDGTFDAGGARYPSLGDDQLHHFEPHAVDYRPGDPNWSDEDGHEGKNIIGFVNYLAGTGLNSQYFLTMNYEGDGWEVWPWTHFNERETFDVSRLAQWEILFSHMQTQGILLHILLTETENESMFEILDGGLFADTRKLYYREMVARFGHHLALIWNLGEENGHDDNGRQYGAGTSAEQMTAFSSYIAATDPYDHPIVVHHYPFEQDQVFKPLIGHEPMKGASLQLDDVYLDEQGRDYNGEIQRWIAAAEAGGHPWIVNLDEPLGWEYGLVTDESVDGGVSQEDARKDVLWGTYMAGGAGVEWYFGWLDNSPTSDLGVEDMRLRAAMWEKTRIATTFFEEHVPFQDMSANNELTTATDDYVLAAPGTAYLIYLRNGGTTELDLSTTSGEYTVRWFNPRSGGKLQTGSQPTIAGASLQPIGHAPSDPSKDWAVLVLPK